MNKTYSISDEKIQKLTDIAKNYSETIIFLITSS